MGLKGAIRQVGSGTPSPLKQLMPGIADIVRDVQVEDEAIR